MSRLAIAIGILAAGLLFGVLQRGRIGELRREVEGLQQEVGGQVPPAGGEVSPVVAESGRTLPPSPPERSPGKARGSGPEEHPGEGGASAAANDLKVSGLIGRMGLTGEQRERLEPLLTEYVAEEQVATSQLLEVMEEFLSGIGAGYGELAAALRRRAGLGSGSGVAEIRGALSTEQQAELAKFSGERMGNVLQLLADAEFGAWRQVVDIGNQEMEQAMYNAFYHVWERRMASPPAEGMGADDLAEWGLRENRAALDAVAGIVPEEDLELMRSAQETLHQMKLRRGR